MIKGVNRQVIEIMDTGNIYYERALLVVRPEYSKAQRMLLEREAKQMLKSLKAPSSIKKRRVIFYWFVRLFLSAAVGSALTLLILWLTLK